MEDVAAVECNSLHAFLVDTITIKLAFGKPQANPAPHRPVHGRFEQDRRLGFEQIRQDFPGHAGGCPRGDVSRCDNTCIAETCLFRDITAPLDDDHFVSRFCEKIRGTHANYTGADYSYLHGVYPKLFIESGSHVTKACTKCDSNTATIIK